MKNIIQKFITRRNIIIGLAAVAVAVLLVFGYFRLKRLGDPVVPAIRAIPESCVLLAEISNAHALAERLFHKSEFWQALIQSDSFRRIISPLILADSVVRASEEASEVFSKNPLYLACIPDGEGYGLLLAINLGGAHEDKLVREFFEKHYPGQTITEISLAGRDVFMLEGDGGSGRCYSVHKGIFLLSDNRNVLLKGLMAADGGPSFAATKAFQYLSGSAGKNVDANIYLRLPPLPGLLRNCVHPDALPAISSLAHSALMAGLDLTLKNSEILLNGYVYVPDTTYLLGKYFGGDPSAGFQWPEMIPATATTLRYWHPEDVLGFMEYLTGGDGHDSVWADELRNVGDLAAFRIRPGINQKNEYSCIAARYTGNLAVVNAGEKVQPLADSISKGVPGEGIPDAFARMLDIQADSIYSSRLKDVVYYSASASAVAICVTAAAARNTLGSDSIFGLFADNMSDDASFGFYFDMGHLSEILEKIFSESISKLFPGQGGETFRNFGGVTLQAGQTGGRFYVNLSLGYQDGRPRTNPLLWRIPSDTVYHLSGVPGKQSGEEFSWVLSGIDGTLLLIDDFGRIAFRLKVREVPEAPVNILSIGKQTALLWKSGNHIICIHPDGKHFPGSPFTISPPAAGCLSLIRYPGQDEPRVLIQGTDRKIRNFHINGKAVAGWIPPSATGVLLSPVRLFRLDGKDILAAEFSDGSWMIYDRKGRPLVAKNKMPAKSRFAGICNIEYEGKQCLATVSSIGSVVIVTADGKTRIPASAKIPTGSYFLATPFLNGKTPDFIIAGPAGLEVFDANFKLLLRKVLPVSPEIEPLFIPGYSGQEALLAVWGSGSLLFINNKGQIVNSLPVRDVTGMELFPWAGGNGRILLISCRNMLVAYYV